MNYEQLEQLIMDYFGDRSRTQEETKDDLLALAQFCESLAESLE